MSQLKIDWLDQIKAEESFFVQTNLINLSNQITVKVEEIAGLISPAPIIFVEPTGTISLTNLGEKNVRNIKFTANTIWAQIIDDNNTAASLEYFVKVVGIILSKINVTNFSRVGIRRQYTYYFSNKEERTKFFKKIVNFDDFIDVGIVKNMLLDTGFIANIQILPTTKNEDEFGVVLDIDLYFEDKDGDKLAISNIKEQADKINNEFKNLTKKIFS